MSGRTVPSERGSGNTGIHVGSSGHAVSPVCPASGESTGHRLDYGGDNRKRSISGKVQLAGTLRCHDSNQFGFLRMNF